jgi:UDP-N-acetylmuramate--alanine ligase
VYKKNQHIHFVGIGGIGMSGIAELLLNLGYRVSGSDLRRSDSTDRLAARGAVVSYGHDRKNLTDADVVVISSAVRSDNPEVRQAHEKNIPVIPRAEMLGELMRLKYGIAIAGAHGKTTTTSLIAAVLEYGGIDPTVVIGGRLLKTNTNAFLGAGDFLVAEADESDGSFLTLPPTIAVVTNIDREHLDYYSDIDQIKSCFLQFLNKVPFYGLCLICLDDEHLQSIIPQMEKRSMTYGRAGQADLQAREITFDGLSTTFTAYLRERKLGRISLRIPGIHNVLNALAAIGVGLELEIPFAIIRKALREFKGIQRRFQMLGQRRGITLIDDYAHHPTEIKMTLKAARQLNARRVVVLFQPHRYSRTQHLFSEFMTAFYDADVLIVAGIYPAGEQPVAGVTSERLFQGLKEYGHRHVLHAGDLQQAEKLVLETIEAGDVFLTLGAGDVCTVGPRIMKALHKAKDSESTQGREKI